MTLSDLALVVLVVVVPIAVVVYLVTAWASGRGSGPAPVIATRGRVDSVVQATTTQQTAVRQSIATQVGMLSHIAIQALGYLVATLRGNEGSPLLDERSGRDPVHVVALGGSYSLDVRLQLAQPSSYQGATVEVVTKPEPVRLGVVVEGAGLQISGGGSTLVGQPAGQPATTTFRVRPVAAGVTKVQVNFYRGNAWAQTLDLTLDVRARPGVETRRAATPVLGPAPGAVDALECSNPLSALDGEPAPRDVHLNVRTASGHAEGRAYAARVAGGGQAWRALDVTLREHDLKEINEGLREALDVLRRALGDRIDVTADELSSPDMRDLVDRLARRGNDAFQRLFPNEADQKYLLELLGNAEQPDVELSTDAFFLAWELLYAPYDPADVGIERFWGFRYNITRVLIDDTRQHVSPRITLHGPPRIAVYVNPELPYAATNELSYFRALADGGKILLHDWLGDTHPEADEATPAEQRRALIAYCGEHSSDITHFACHAVAKPYSPDSFLALSGQLRMTIEDMRVEKLRLPGSPLVVLNACGVGVRDPLKTSDFIRRFMASNGGRGVVATECDVPDLFASAFIREVYDRILAGEPVARALFTARRDFLTTRGNPLGLMYSAYLSLDTRCQRA